MLYHRNLHCGYNRMNSVFPAITKINATEAHMFEHYMIQVCPFSRKILLKNELCFFPERGRDGSLIF